MKRKHFEIGNPVDEAYNEKPLNSEVKEESKNRIDSLNTSENLDNKTNSLDASESDSDYNPDYIPKKKKKKQSKKVHKKKRNGDTSENINLSRKKRVIPKRDKPNVEVKLEPIDEYENTEYFDPLENSNFALSEEFIMLILQQVDDLCENIKNGDQNIDRTLKVSKNLNDAVNCYRNKIEPIKPIIDQSKYQENYDDIDVNGLDF